ncbi:ATP synthase F1 subunit delta [Mariniblastus fucicola]|uniref:ATP synthase subunit delta n=1 Tax=Mariniblastus fucicola TaxID=980251 RepID=A0A5B9PI98_9BACT|nr:ATP synthase F1 subunit delta [Mariniblastus fucicola]QEG24396.1 ATP synthase subunit delta [Mariniblastus fucicola]
MDDTQQPTVFDTDQQQLGDVYAKAFLGFAKESGKLDAMVEELGEVVGVFNELPKFRLAMESPRIDAADKTSMLDKAFKGKCSDGLLNFLKMVAQRDRFDCLNSIHSSTVKAHDEMAGRVKATLTTASEIETSVQDSVAKKLSGILGKEVTLVCVVDPDIVGGMVVRVGDTVYDGSVVNQLQQVRAKAVKKAVDAFREKLDKFITT